MHCFTLCFTLFASLVLTTAEPQQEPWQKQISGVYPHLAMFNDENECGTGAVVPWLGRLWVLTYAPHCPTGSSDKLYEITPDLRQVVRRESIGGTPANRMVHCESQQLFIGPYVIDANGKVRTISYDRMFGRLTGNARHLTEPAKKIYAATMEEGIYEIDVDTLAVKTLYYDEQAEGSPKANLPGYHGKGLYSGQGRLIYANNGEHGDRAKHDPFVPSGVLAQWDGKKWEVVRRAQFTEVTGPGGIFGNTSPATDPIWCVGWDARSLIVQILDQGKWFSYRLPKASHSYDGAHGWNTEWPRIRDIGEDDLLMTMHGMFWRFPKTFSHTNSAGIAPRSTYLKVIGDFCRWYGGVVFGCDDTARSEFLNKRKAKGDIPGPQSQSNLWFVEPERLDHLGDVIGRGAVWLNDEVSADTPSEPFLFSGFQKRAVHLDADVPTTFTFEIDRHGNGIWEPLTSINVDGYRWYAFDESTPGVWIRLKSSANLQKATAWFHYSNDAREATPNTPSLFAGIAKPGESSVVGGLVRPRAKNRRTLQFAAKDANGKIGNYILDGEMNLKPDGDDTAWQWLEENAAIPARSGVLMVDAASVIYIDDNGERFRLPKNEAYRVPGPLGFGRICREVATERDLFNCHGTFYELPANNAAGFRRIRPVATHNLEIYDYCSYRGLLIISGVDLEKGGANSHIIRSDDGKAALWAGVIDDIWQLGKPVGNGGPWLASEVVKNTYSDPYLMTGYDRKTLTLNSSKAATIRAEIDITGMGDWKTYKTFPLQAGQSIHETFPREFSAYWIRFISDTDTTATAQLEYR